MSFLLHTFAMIDGKPTDGLQCFAYAESRFSGVIPAVGSPVPDGSPPDAGPVASDPSFGGTGAVQLTVPDAANYYVGCYTNANPAQIAWEGPKMATPHTSLQAIPAVSSFGSYGAQTSIAAGSNGAALPQSTINVTSFATFNWPSSGHLLVNVPVTGWQLIAYAALTSTTFTGCTGGTGNLATGNSVIEGIVIGSHRTIAIATFLTTTSDTGAIQGITTIAGLPIGSFGSPVGVLGVVTGLEAAFERTVICDPLGAYGFLVSGTAGTVESILAVEL